MNVPVEDRQYVTWADRIFNPWLSKHRTVSPGQGNFGWLPERATSKGEPSDAFQWEADAEPFRRQMGRRQRIFAGPWCQVLEKDALRGERDAFWHLVRGTPSLDWLVLMSRDADPLAHLPSDWAGGFPNVWIGAKLTGSSAARDVRALVDVPASTRFVMVADMLGDLGELELSGVDWAILAMKPADAEAFDSVASVRLLCAAYGVPCWFEELDRTGMVTDIGAWRQEPKRREQTRRAGLPT